jgi:hypothetical protein
MRAGQNKELRRTPDTAAAPPVMGDLGALPLEDLEQEIGELAAHIHAATCRWLLLVAEHDRRGGWATWGCRSCAAWLSFRCGIAPGAAREQVRVARKLAELPLIRAAFGEGRLSFSKVRAISRVATERSEAELLELALHATAAQLERIVRAYRGAADLAAANAGHRERYVSWQWDEDGSLVVRGRLPAEEGALLLRALEAARDAIPAACAEAGDVSAETSETSAEADRDRPRRSNADALVHVAEASLASGETGRTGGDRYQLVVHADATTLAEPEATGRCELEDGGPVCAETARRIACDASVVAIVERDGRPLGVGRKTRTIPPAVRRALHSRDGCCRFPGCTQRRFVDAHHIHHWAHGGETKLNNLVLLCRHHHRLLHEGGFRVERRSGGGLRFRRPDGRPVWAGAVRVRGDHGEVRRRNRRAGLRIHPDVGLALSAGDAFSMDLTVGGLMEREPQPAW